MHRCNLYVYNSVESSTDSTDQLARGVRHGFVVKERLSHLPTEKKMLSVPRRVLKVGSTIGLKRGQNHAKASPALEESKSFGSCLRIISMAPAL